MTTPTLKADPKEVRRGRKLRQYTTTCRHFNGISNTTCKQGVAYEGLATPQKQLVCLGGTAGADKCQGYNPLTEAEAEVEIAKFERFIELTAQGLSGCCEAALDEREVITEGRYKGHGPRYCSQCGNVVFIV